MHNARPAAILSLGKDDEMVDLGEQLRVPAARLQRTFPGPIEAVWAHLTECDKLPEWFGSDGSIEPREGGRLSFLGGHVRGVITRWAPPRKLAYTWNVFGPQDDQSPYPESYLSFELSEAGEAVSLVLLHLPILERFERQTAMGWRTFLDILEDTMRGRDVLPRRSYMERNAALYGVDLDNLQR